jgi:hypothetical protein
MRTAHAENQELQQRIDNQRTQHDNQNEPQMPLRQPFATPLGGRMRDVVDYVPRRCFTHCFTH